MKNLALFILTFFFVSTAYAWPCRKDPGDPHHCHPKPEPKAVVELPELSEKDKTFYGVYAGLTSTIIFGTLRDHKWGVLKSYLIAVGSSVFLVRHFEDKELRREVDRATLPGAMLGPMLFFTF